MSKKLTFSAEIEEFDSEQDLSREDRELLQAAKEAAGSAYAPYSNFYVGAALLLENGVTFKGNNQENVAYPSGLCAERVAMFAAGAQYPGVAIKKVAVTAKSKAFDVDYPLTPCGACRQVMAEYEARYSEDISLILMGETGKVHMIKSVKDMLPFMFNEEGLKRNGVK